MKRPLAVSCGYFLLGLIAARATVENKIVAISILALGILGLYISNRITKVKFVVLLLFLFEALGFATGFGFFQAGSTQADLAYMERSAVQMDLMLISMKKHTSPMGLQDLRREIQSQVLLLDRQKEMQLKSRYRSVLESLMSLQKWSIGHGN